MGSLNPPRAPFQGRRAVEWPGPGRRVWRRIDGAGVTVHFSGLAPFFAGLYQVNVQLPGNLAAGRHRLAITVNGLSSNEVQFDVGN